MKLIQHIGYVALLLALPLSSALAQSSTTGIQMLPPTQSGTQTACTTGSNSLLTMTDSGTPGTNMSAINCVPNATLSSTGAFSTLSTGYFGNNLTVGGAGSFAGNVGIGIGTESPTGALQIGPSVPDSLIAYSNPIFEANGNGRNVAAGIFSGNNANFAYFAIGTGGAEDIEIGAAGRAGQFFSTAAQGDGILKGNYEGTGNILMGVGSGSETMRLTSNRRVGIGTTTPQYTLDVNGTANVATTVTVGSTVTVGNTVTVGGQTANSSTVATANALTTAPVCSNGQALSKTGADQYGCINVADLGSISATVPTCASNQVLTFNGTSFSCLAQGVTGINGSNLNCGSNQILIGTGSSATCTSNLTADPSSGTIFSGGLNVVNDTWINSSGSFGTAGGKAWISGADGTAGFGSVTISAGKGWIDASGNGGFNTVAVASGQSWMDASGNIGMNGVLNMDNQVFMTPAINGYAAGLNVNNQAMLNTGGLALNSSPGGANTVFLNSANGAASFAGNKTWIAPDGGMQVASGQIILNGIDGSISAASNKIALLTDGSFYVASGNAAILANGNASFASVSCGSGCYPSSDIRLKTDLHKVNDGLDVIMALKPMTWLWKDEKKNEALVTDPDKTARKYGFVAQDIEKVLPDLVHKISTNGKADTLAVDYNGIIAPLVKAVQEQQAEIKAQHDEIEALKAELAKQQP